MNKKISIQKNQDKYSRGKAIIYGDKKFGKGFIAEDMVKGMPVAFKRLKKWK